MHGDLYCYDKVIYKTSSKNIEIICNKCGLHFLVTPNNHTNSNDGGSGCPNCKGGVSDTKESFIKKSIIKYGDKFLYDKVEYVKAKKDVTITCKIHGDFKITPGSFLASRTQFGCHKCADESTSKKFSKSEKEFLEDAKKKYGDKFQYDLSG